MEITRRNAGAVVVVELVGRLDAVTAPSLDAYLKEVFATEARDVLLLLDRLQYISSAGLRSILMAARQVTARQGRLVLAGLSGAVKEVFAMAGFDTILRLRDNEAEALTELA